MRTLFITTTNSELKNKYTAIIREHNAQVLLNHPNAGFDLLNPDNILTRESMIKIDTQVVCALVDENQKNCSFYLFPRSSISKTKLRLANSVGIIDSGYRGNIIGVFDILPSYDSNTQIEKHSRLLQICSGDLQPFIVEIIEDSTQLGLTSRGMGGFGSTGI